MNQSSRSHQYLLGILVFMASFSAQFASAGHPKELGIFKSLAGKYKCTGKTADAPGKPGTEFKAKWELTPVLGGAAYLETYLDDGKKESANSVGLLWGYDSKSGKYVRGGANGSGDWATATGSANGETLTWDVNPTLKFLLTKKGKTVEIKADAMSGSTWSTAATIVCK